MTTAMKLMKKETGARNCYIMFLFIIIMINTTATQECSVVGLSDLEVKEKGNIHFIHNEKPLQLSMSCRCSVYQPLWQFYNLETGEISNPFNGNVKCINATNGEICDDNIAFIVDPDPEKYLEAYNVFNITHSMVIMCFSSFHRETVIFNISGQKDDYMLPIFSSSVFRELPQSTCTESRYMQSVFFSEEYIKSTSVIVESTTDTAELFTIIIQPSITFNDINNETHRKLPINTLSLVLIVLLTSSLIMSSFLVALLFYMLRKVRLLQITGRNLMLKHSTHTKLATSFDISLPNSFVKGNIMKKSFSEHTYFANPVAIVQNI